MWQAARPRECRPFPDYDPRLNGRQYNPAANQKDCPECFLPDGRCAGRGVFRLYDKHNELGRSNNARGGSLVLTQPCPMLTTPPKLVVHAACYHVATRHPWELQRCGSTTPLCSTFVDIMHDSTTTRPLCVAG
jgi:hypothetical protein